MKTKRPPKSFLNCTSVEAKFRNIVCMQIRLLINPKEEGVDRKAKILTLAELPAVGSAYLVYSGPDRALQYHLKHLCIWRLLVNGHC
jgi:hypothetical protein